MVNKLTKLSRNLANLHKLYKEIKHNGPKEVVDAVREQINKGKYTLFNICKFNLLLSKKHFFRAQLFKESLAERAR